MSLGNIKIGDVINAILAAGFIAIASWVWNTQGQITSVATKVEANSTEIDTLRSGKRYTAADATHDNDRHDDSINTLTGDVGYLRGRIEAMSP